MRTSATDEIMKSVNRMLANDAFQNNLARLGYGTPNVMEGTAYPLTRITNDYELLNSLYRSHWVVRNVVDMIPEDMTKNWIRIVSQLKPEEITKIDRIWRVRRLKAAILHGLKWGRLYGGAVGLIMIEGHDDILDQPLDYDTIMPGSLKNIMVVDRWTGAYPSSELVDDVNDVEFGLPDYYEINLEHGRALTVHHSRVIRFVGRELPYWEKLAEVNWGASEVEVVFEELKKRDNTSWNIAQLVFLANLRVMKMGDLGQDLAIQDGEMQKDLYNTLQAQNWLMSNMGLYVMDSNDSMETHQYSFAGINDIYQSFMMDLSGACKIPVTKLFGRSPAGMNATGESDMDNYYDTVEQAQESTLSPILDKILPIICVSELGYIPDDLDYAYNPIQEPNDQEVADLVDKKGNLLNTLFTSGAISQKVVLMELKQMADSTGMFTNITDKQIALASDTTDEGEVIPPDVFSTVGAKTPDRAGIPERDQTGDAKTWKFGDWLRRPKRDH